MTLNNNLTIYLHTSMKNSTRQTEALWKQKINHGGKVVKWGGINHDTLRGGEGGVAVKKNGVWRSLQFGRKKVTWFEVIINNDILWEYLKL